MIAVARQRRGAYTVAAWAWLGLAAAACGPPPSREQHTIYAAAPTISAPAQAAPTPSAKEPAAPADDAPQPAPDSVTLQRWLEPLQSRDARAWVAAFDERATLQVAGDPRTREGRAQLAGWLQGHVLAWPFRSVRSVHAGPSGQPGVEVRVLELLDSCDHPVVRLTAKLTLEDAHYSHAWIQLQPVTAAACPP